MWRLTHDGQLVRDFETEIEAWKWIHDTHSFSVFWATHYEGYQLEEIQ